MNTLRITKGSDVKLSVDGESLFFVTDFCAQESCEQYPIREFLSDTDVDKIMLKKNYKITITALSHLDKAVFCKDFFTLTVDDSDTVYEYLSCQLLDHTRDIKPDKPIVDKYTIIASDMKTYEGVTA